MKKFIYCFTLSTLLVLVVFSSTVMAEENKKVNNVDIEILKDGRVAPVANSQNLSEDQLDSILSEIGYTSKSIDNYNIKLKRELVSLGGKALELEETEMEYKYINDGVKSKLTSDNFEDIKKEIESNSDFKNSILESYTKPEDGISLFAAEDCTTSNGNCDFEKFTGRIQVMKIGETSSQSQYLIQQDWEWIDDPWIQGTDYAGVHWGSKGEPEAGSAYGEFAYRLFESDVWQYRSINMDTSSNYGFSADLPYLAFNPGGAYGDFRGAMMEVVNINKTTNPPGSRVTISGIYAHPHTPNNWSIGVGAYGISISGNIGSGDELSWRRTFTVQ